MLEQRSLTYDDRIHVTDRCVHLSVCTDVYISSQSDWLVGEVYSTVPLSLFCPFLEHYNSWPYIHNVRNGYTHSLGNKVENRKKLSKFGQISSLCPSRIHLLYRLNSNLTSMNRASLLGNVPLCTKSTGMHTWNKQSQSTINNIHDHTSFQRLHPEYTKDNS